MVTLYFLRRLNRNYPIITQNSLPCIALQNVNYQNLSLYNYQTRPSCSKLTTLLVNVSLKFQMLISEICQYFLLIKCEKLLHCTAKACLIFSTKIFSVFGYKVIKHLTS